MAKEPVTYNFSADPNTYTEIDPASILALQKDVVISAFADDTDFSDDDGLPAARLGFTNGPLHTVMGMGMGIYEDKRLTEKVLVSNSRSPSRAKRRAARGFRQCVKRIVQPLKTAYVVDGNKLYIHPETWAKVEERLRKYLVKK